MTPATDARAAELRAKVAWHKAAIRRHRQQLGDAAAALLALERQRCQAMGIRVTEASPQQERQRHGTDGTHGSAD